MGGKTIVIGGSAGGLRALSIVLASLPASYPHPIISILHQGQGSGSQLAGVLSACCALPVKEAEDKEVMVGGRVYVAAAGYHLLVERDRSFALSLDDKVSFSRPSVDVLFESAAEAIGPDLVGVLLTGANRDGCDGMRRIKELGGLTVAQDPASAEVAHMPRAAIEAGVVDHVIRVEGIGPFLVRLAIPGRPHDTS